MLIPSLISRSSLVLKVKGNKSYVSNTFIARFGNGEEKFLNREKWVLTSLLNECEMGEPVYLAKDVCTLYYRDWQNVPTFGSWDKNYPPAIQN